MSCCDMCGTSCSADFEVKNNGISVLLYTIGTAEHFSQIYTVLQRKNIFSGGLPETILIKSFFYMEYAFFVPQFRACLFLAIYR